MYQAGFCELDITPPIGTIIPGYFHARYSQGVLDPLYARACVIRQGDGYAAFVTADCCGLYRCVTDEVRRRVAEQTPIPAGTGHGYGHPYPLRRSHPQLGGGGPD